MKSSSTVRFVDARYITFEYFYVVLTKRFKIKICIFDLLLFVISDNIHLIKLHFRVFLLCKYSNVIYRASTKRTVDEDFISLLSFTQIYAVIHNKFWQQLN